MCYHKYTEVYVYIFRYSWRKLKNYEFSLDSFLNLYQYHFPVLSAPLKQLAILQVPAKILTFSQVDDLPAKYYLLVLKELYK